MSKPNILYIMTDQQRADTIAALGNPHIYTPNFDRLVRRGISFTNAYSPCPVCVPARYIIRTGCLPTTTRCFTNGRPEPVDCQAETMTGRCGPYLAQTMAQRGYRTFGVGKFHTIPHDEPLGYETHLYSEEIYSEGQRATDAYAQFIAEHPAYAHVEQLQGERTEMYYMPQTSVFPPELTVESWAADRAIEAMSQDDARPWFGFVSFVGPHPPLAPPIPFNRMYDPDRMPAPVVGEREVDHMDEQLPYMNQAIWAEDVDPLRAACCKARYYGEISYIDWCLGKILDAVEAREDADNTLICFFSDHGEHLGDHHSWQKESFFEASAHVPFLLSWPARLAADERRGEMVGLHDLFAIATAASGDVETRDGINLLAMVEGREKAREHFLGSYGMPGTPRFKIMVRWKQWKYIYLANGGREQLFNVEEDPDEVVQRASTDGEVRERLRRVAIEACRHPGAADALEGDDLRAFDFEARSDRRIYQLAADLGVEGFPERPEDALEGFLSGR